MSFSNGADAILVNPARYSEDQQHQLLVGMEDSPLARYILNRWLATSGFDRRKVRPILLSPQLHVAAMQQGRVDAIITYQPFSRQLRLAGHEVIFSSADIAGEVLDVMVIRLDQWQRHQQRLQHLVNSWQDAVEFIQQTNSDEFRAITALSGLNADDVQQILGQIEFFSPQQSASFLQNDFPKVASTVTESIIAAGGLPHVNKLPVCPGVTP